jgi:hypothetical protein
MITVTFDPTGRPSCTGLVPGQDLVLNFPSVTWTLHRIGEQCISTRKDEKVRKEKR